MQYLLADGDGVGDRVELLLLDGLAANATVFSAAVSDAVRAIEARLMGIGCCVVFAGGDEICARMDAGTFALATLEEIRELFLRRTGCTMSIGIGKSTREAVASLRRAKLLGKNRIVGMSQ